MVRLCDTYCHLFVVVLLLIHLLLMVFVNLLMLLSVSFFVMLLRALLGRLCDRVSGIDVRAARDRCEVTDAYRRPLGYESLVVAMRPIAKR